ncbi:hypothetical protein IFR05_017532, partial [Cadophora sp. M221]
ADQVNKGSRRRIYHSSHELIASNYIDVLDVLSFAGEADVYHWFEDDDNLPSNLFWRQTYNQKTLELSMNLFPRTFQLRMHCLYDGYLNPDDTMYICDNRKCKVYFHENHLIDDCLAKTYERVVSTDVALGVAKSTLYKGILEATITDLRPGADPKT